MNQRFVRRVTFALLFAFASGLVAPPRSRAEDPASSSNITLGIAAVVAVTALVIAWRMDFGRDDEMITYKRDVRLTGAKDDRLALVLTDWKSADEDRAEIVSGVGLRAWF